MTHLQMIHQRLYGCRPVGPNLIGSDGEVLPEHLPVEAERVDEHVGPLGLPVHQRPLPLGCQEDGRDGRKQHAPVRQLVVERPRSRSRSRGAGRIVLTVSHRSLPAAVHLGDGGVRARPC